MHFRLSLVKMLIGGLCMICGVALIMLELYSGGVLGMHYIIYAFLYGLWVRIFSQCCLVTVSQYKEARLIVCSFL